MCLYCVYYQNKKIFLIDFKRRYVIFLVRVYKSLKRYNLSNVMEVTCLKQITWHDLQHIIKDGDVIGLPALAVTYPPKFYVLC